MSNIVNKDISISKYEKTRKECQKSDDRKSIEIKFGEVRNKTNKNSDQKSVEMKIPERRKKLTKSCEIIINTFKRKKKKKSKLCIKKLIEDDNNNDGLEVTCISQGMSKIPQQGEQYENIENVLNDLEGLSYGKSVMQEPEEKVNKKEECDNKSLINNNFDSTDMLKKSHLTKFIKQFKLENEICYHGMLPRRDICELLKNNGDFIVRISELCVNKNSHTDKEVKRFMLVLSVLHQNNSVHYMIKVSKNKEIYISDMAFKTLGNLISYYVEKQIPITKTGKVKLISPVPRQSWELQHNQIVLKTKCGSGAFGEVWSGTLTTKNDVYEIAAKVLKNRSNINMNSVREFCAEARVMREYSHPNIVRLYGVAVNEDPVMLIMEYANRGSLDAILRKRKLRPNMDERILYCLQAARGIEYLHEKNCLHRDIAARNCLLSDTCLKVSDFGMTIKFRMGEKGVKMNDINMKIPLRWSAPETVFYGKFTFKTDVFSFGILLWEIYGEGKAPYPKYQMKEVINMLHEGKRLQAQSIMPDEIKFIMETMCFPQECSQRANMKEIRKGIEEYYSLTTQK